MSKDAKPRDIVGMTEQQNLDAGRFSSWLHSTRSAQISDSGADVPCGECNACCRSSYFIHIRPEETETLSRIPGELLFPAPGLPKDTVLLGYDEKGRCPMLIDGKCSIYEHRPLTCRSYDCRVFSAAGIAPGEDDKALIAERVRRWKFSYLTESERKQHSAVQAAATFLRERAECFPAGVVPRNSTQVAIFAIKVYKVFLRYEYKSGETGCAPDDFKIAKAVMEANERFEGKYER